MECRTRSGRYDACMDLDANSILASFAVGGAGFVAFAYGKKQGRLPQMVVGLVMMIFPYFVPTVWLMLAIGAALLALLWVAVRLGW